MNCEKEDFSSGEEKSTWARGIRKLSVLSLKLLGESKIISKVKVKKNLIPAFSLQPDTVPFVLQNQAPVLSQVMSYLASSRIPAFFLSFLYCNVSQSRKVVISLKPLIQNFISFH